MIRLKARDGEVLVLSDAIGKRLLPPDWEPGVYRIWLKPSDLAKLRNSEIMRWAIDP